MRIVCAQCKVVIREEDGQEPVGRISHGLCPVCAAAAHAEMDRREAAAAAEGKTKGVEE